MNELELTSDPDSLLLSIVMTGRDDDYMPDFRYRLTTTLDYLAAGLARLGQLHRVEILVTDWGSRVPIAETVRLSGAAAAMSRFVYVGPAEVHAVQNGRDDFHIALAVNTGLRRGGGQFLMAASADTLFTPPALDALLGLLGGTMPLPSLVDVRRTYFLCRRYHVPWQFVERRPTVDQWDRYLLLHAGEYEKDRGAVFGVSAGSGALLMSRELWHQARGLDERLGGWGFNDVELGLRMAQGHPWMDLSYLGIAAYHMQHPPGRGRRAIAIQDWQANPRIHNTTPQANDENWGLGDKRLPVQPARSDGGRCGCPLRAEVAPTGPAGHGQAVAADARSGSAPRFASVTEIERQLTGPDVRRDVIDIIRRIKTQRRDWTIDRSDLTSLHLLAWYARHYHPRRYLEFGAGRGYAALLVGHICPSVEVYCVDRWQGVLHQHDPNSIGSLRQETAHCGHLRFINGDPNTALDRLRDSFVGTCEFDLVLLCQDTVRDVTVQLRELLKHLSFGGALVLRARNAAAFEPSWNEIRMAHSHYTCLRPMGASTGLIVNAAVAHDPDCADWETLTQLATKRLEVMIDRLERPSWVRAVLPRVARGLMRPQRYSQYANRVIRWLGRTSAGTGQSRPVKAKTLRAGGP